MATLTTNEKQVLEKLFQMGGGSVLNFTNRTIEEFFRDDVGISIYDNRYNYASGSKANRIRGFWQIASDALVGKSIQKLIEYIENQLLIDQLKKEDFSQELIKKTREIADRLLGFKSHIPEAPEMKEDEFVNRDFKDASINKLGLDSAVSGVLEQRILIRRC
jgi:hypothetical protein